jgi:hypothetical protein
MEKSSNPRNPKNLLKSPRRGVPSKLQAKAKKSGGVARPITARGVMSRASLVLVFVAIHAEVTPMTVLPMDTTVASHKELPSDE